MSAVDLILFIALGRLEIGGRKSLVKGRKEKRVVKKMMKDVLTNRLYYPGSTPRTGKCSKSVSQMTRNVRPPKNLSSRILSYTLKIGS